MRRLRPSGILGLVIVVGCGGRLLAPDDSTGSGGAASGGTTSGGTTSGGSGATGGAGGVGGTSGGTGGAIDPGPEWSACTGPGQCELVMAQCCGVCGILGLDKVVAINSQNRAAFQKKVCAPPTPCDPCLSTIDPHLMARCEAGRCMGFDIGTDPGHTGCSMDGDCTLRKGLTCCECQAPGDWVAVSHAGNMTINAEACAPGTPCLTCAPVPPAGTKTACVSGVCQKFP